MAPVRTNILTAEQEDKLRQSIDEYVGSSWSLNTAKDALEKGIFDGDLVGADHTPLQRQQAILYASIYDVSSSCGNKIRFAPCSRR